MQTGPWMTSTIETDTETETINLTGDDQITVNESTVIITLGVGKRKLYIPKNHIRLEDNEIHIYNGDHLSIVINATDSVLSQLSN